MRSFAAIGAGLTTLIAVLAVSGCKTKPDRSPIGPVQARRPAPPPPTLEEIAKPMNERAAQLQRVWARAVTSVSWTDPEGNRRGEQGEGFFQLIQPSRFALDIGKVGEVVIWFGCDDERYWLIRRGDEKSAVIGRHDGPGSDRMLEEGLPATPRDLIELAGVTGVDTKAKPISLGWTDDGLWRLEEKRPFGTLVREINPKTGEPLRIKVMSAGAGGAAVVRVESELENYVWMELANTSNWPRMPTRIKVRDLRNGSEIVVGLEGLTDGIRGRRPGNERMKPEVFNFDVLKDRLGVEKVENVDAPAVVTPRSMVGSMVGSPAAGPAASPPPAPAPASKQTEPAKVVPPAVPPAVKEPAPKSPR
ncbi:MAG: hypothetical protein ACKVZJ_07315 [Phycisphaerales bacterium]